MVLRSLKKIRLEAESVHGKLFFDSSTILVEYFLQNPDQSTLDNLRQQIVLYNEFIAQPTVYTVRAASKNFDGLLDIFGEFATSANGSYSHGDLETAKSELTDLIKKAKKKFDGTYEGMLSFHHKPKGKISYSELEHKARDFTDGFGKRLPDPDRSLLAAAFYNSMVRSSPSYIAVANEQIENNFKIFVSRLKELAVKYPRIASVLGPDGLCPHPVTVYEYKPGYKSFELVAGTHETHP